jgi:hypothetical protein
MELEINIIHALKAPYSTTAFKFVTILTVSPVPAILRSIPLLLFCVVWQAEIN